MTDAVTCEVLYLDHDSELPVSIMTGTGDGTFESRGSYSTRSIQISNARQLEPAADVETNGFSMCKHVSTVADFYDDDEVRNVYYPEVSAFLRAELNASEVVVFDHNTRAELRAPGRPDAAREPVHLVHNDFTVWSGAERVHRELGTSRAERLLQGRLSIINVWRPITGPLESKPLAVCDAQSLTIDDLVAADMVYEHRTGSEYRATFSPAHRWYYYPGLNVDELLLIKVCDTDEGTVSRFCLHTAFDHPDTTPASRPRESIELRVMVFYL